ncbi:MAG: leucine-rich repeat protein [Clostridium sp.]|nr:leucine-rich repeat protein [Clostridium sp.]
MRSKLKEKKREEMRKKEKQKGITLIALVITIVVLLILAGVSISMITGDNGVITNAQKSKLSTTFSAYKEEVDLYKASKYAENRNFLENTLEAGKTSLSYNTKDQDEEGNIKTIITTITEADMEKFEIIKGKLLIKTKDVKEIKVAQSLGIEVNPYDITEDGELQSSDGNLLLVDETGTLKISDSVTKIGEGAFANVEGLKKIIIPGSVKEIGKNAFAHNPTLETVSMEEGVEIIGESAFFGCGKLKNVSMPESLFEIRSSAFMNASSLEKIKISSKVRIINSYTFSGDINLKEAILPENVETIARKAFEGTKFEEIVIPEKVKKIEVGVFDGNLQLNDIKIQGRDPQYVYESGMLMPKEKDNILFISDKYLKSINNFSIPNGVTGFRLNISQYTNITKIIIPDTINDMGIEVFPTTINEIEVSENNKTFAINKDKKILYIKNSKNIISCYSKDENIDLREEDIKNLASYSFKQAINAKNIILPNSLQAISSQVFTNCKKVEEIKIGAGVTYIDPLFKYKNYSGKVIIDKENQNYTIEDNALYNKNKTKLITVLYNIEGEYNINKNLEEIGMQAFHGQYEMTKVNIPKGIKKINDSFMHCNGLREVNIPNTVEEIGENAFFECQNLDTINIDKTKDLIPGAPWGAVKGMRVVNWKEL